MPYAAIKDFLPAIAGFLVFFGILFVTVGAAIPARRDPIFDRLNTLPGNPITMDQIEMQAPFTDRFVRPLTSQLSRILARFTPTVALDNTQRQLMLAGLTRRMTVSDFVGLRGLFTIIGAALGLAMAIFTSQSTLQFVFIVVIFTLFTYLMPTLWLLQQISRRRAAVIRALPDAIDLLTISVEAGLGFDQALDRVVKKTQDELAVEFARVLYEMQFGVARRDALHAMAERVGVEDVNTFVAAIVQAEQLGASMANVLHIQSVEMRVRRRQYAQRLAHLAPIKMLFPIALLIFPPVFVVVLGPAIPSIVRAFLPGFPL